MLSSFSICEGIEYLHMTQLTPGADDGILADHLCMFERVKGG